MWNLLEAEMLVTAPVEIDYRDGFFHVVERFGENCVIRKAVPPNIYFQSLHRANKALAQWCAEQRRESVVPFKMATG